MNAPVREKIILGIDPGTTIMGYGVLRVVGNKPELVTMGIIEKIFESLFKTPPDI